MMQEQRELEINKMKLDEKERRDQLGLGFLN